MMPNLKKYLVKGPTIISRSINVQTVESNISLQLEKLQNKFLKKVDIGSYPFFKLGKIGVAIVLSSQYRDQLRLCEKKLNQIIKIKKIKKINN